jgi:hypothetical protein
MAQSFVLGYFIGKGKIEIQRKLTKEEKKQLEESAQKQEEALGKYNKALQAIINYTDVVGDE